MGMIRHLRGPRWLTACRLLPLLLLGTIVLAQPMSSMGGGGGSAGGGSSSSPGSSSSSPSSSSSFSTPSSSSSLAADAVASSTAGVASSTAAGTDSSTASTLSSSAADSSTAVDVSVFSSSSGTSSSSSYSWDTSEYSSCSVSCGLGVSYSVVRCLDGTTVVSSSYCDSSTKPSVTTKQCFVTECVSSSTGSDDGGGSEVVVSSSSSSTVLVLGIVFGVIGFLLLLTLVLMVRRRRLEQQLGPGLPRRPRPKANVRLSVPALARPRPASVADYPSNSGLAFGGGVAGSLLLVSVSRSGAGVGGASSPAGGVADASMSESPQRDLLEPIPAAFAFSPRDPTFERHAHSSDDERDYSEDDDQEEEVSSRSEAAGSASDSAAGLQPGRTPRRGRRLANARRPTHPNSVASSGGGGGRASSFASRTALSPARSNVVRRPQAFPSGVVGQAASSAAASAATVVPGSISGRVRPPLQHPRRPGPGLSAAAAAVFPDAIDASASSASAAAAVASLASAADSLPPGSDACTICFAAVCDALCVPCGHASFCFACLSRWNAQCQQCPVCRWAIEQVSRRAPTKTKATAASKPRSPSAAGEHTAETFAVLPKT